MSQGLPSLTGETSPDVLLYSFPPFRPVVFHAKDLCSPLRSRVTNSKIIVVSEEDFVLQRLVTRNPYFAVFYQQSSFVLCPPFIELSVTGRGTTAKPLRLLDDLNEIQQ